MATPKKLLICCFLFAATTSLGSDISIEGIEWTRNNANQQFTVKFTLSWNNSWHNDRNHDAAWIFFKYASPSYRQAMYRHARVNLNGHRLLTNHVGKAPVPAFDVSEDKVGLFIYPSKNYRG